MAGREEWHTSVACAQAMADAIARGDDVPHAPAIATMTGMWRAAAGAGDACATYAAPLDERLRSFLPLAYKAAAQVDARWPSADLIERLNTFMAALFAADTHPQAEMATAMKKVAKRAFVDEASLQRKEKYFFLTLVLGAAVVFSAPWMFGWPQVLLGALAADALFAVLAE